MRATSRIVTLAGVLALAVALGARADDVETKRGNIGAGGAFTCDFGLPPTMDFGAVPGILERDRMYMSARPGFMRKLIPLRIEFSTGELASGGRYLFATREDADAYKSWVETEFVLDGALFFSRPYFLAPECHAWSVIGTQDFTPLDAPHSVIRTERWEVPFANQRKLLADRWPSLVSEARARGLAGVWLLYNKQEQLVSLVYMNEPALPDPNVPDFAALAAMELAPPLGALFADQGWARAFDKSHWTLTTWFPFASGDRGEPSLWPNSPPFPQPYPGDGVCEPSRGENGNTAPMDCPSSCGDGLAQPGETNANCPGDVPYS
ncbi:MAG: hypothetical protein ACRD2J_10860 [Thermoanaerobaculia bacterium]